MPLGVGSHRVRAVGMLAAAPGIFPAVAAILLLIGGFLSFKAYGRE